MANLSQLYPKWKYARDGRAEMVADPEAEAALGEGWADRSTAFAEEAKAPEAPAVPAERPKATRSRVPKNAAQE